MPTSTELAELGAPTGGGLEFIYIPEPSTLLLLSTGVLGLFGYARRRR
jgi:hypothetical protein